MKQNFKKHLWMGICIALITWFGISHYQSEKEHAQRIAGLEATRSVAVLPNGVEEAWLRYINKRLSEEIQREGQNLKVRVSYIGAEPSYTYVSLNHPYKIDCNEHDLGFGVSFEEGENGVDVALTGDLSSDFKNEPERFVAPDSIASRNLDVKLCGYVASQLSALIQQPSQH